MAIYEKKEIVKRTGIGKLLGKEPKENYAIALEHYLAIYENDFSKAKQQDITLIDNKYGKGLSNTEKYEIRCSMLRKYWKYILEDEMVSDIEKSQSSILFDLLSLSDADEKSTIQSLTQSFVQPLVNKIVSSRRYSYEDEKQLKDFENKLKLKINLDTPDPLSTYRKLWLIENGELPVIENVDINLQKNETVFFMQKIDWIEERTQTKRVSYAGISTRVRLVKGVYIKTGTYEPHKITSTQYVVIDTGMLYLTNKRFIFIGSKGGKTIPLSKILSYTPYSNAIEIIKETGKPPVFKLYSQDGEELSMLLSIAYSKE